MAHQHRHEAMKQDAEEETRVSPPGISPPSPPSPPGISPPGVSPPGVSAPGVSAPGVSAPEVSPPGVSAPGLALTVTEEEMPRIHVTRRGAVGFALFVLAGVAFLYFVLPKLAGV